MSYEPFGYGRRWWDRLAPHRFHIFPWRTRLILQVPILCAIVVIILIKHVRS
jgi:hypothetical protein